MFGKDELKNVIYLIDYGLCKKYRYRSGQHIKYAYTQKLNGTARYASIHALSGYELSRRDDLEELCYMIVFLMHGRLPWEKINNKNKHERYKMIYHMKKNLTAEQLIKDIDKNEFVEFINYCRGLKFEENPNYEFLRGLMVKYLNRNNIVIKTDNDINLILFETLSKGKNRKNSSPKKIQKKILEKVCEEESLSNFDYYNDCINEAISKSIEDIGKKVRTYSNSCTKNEKLNNANKNNIKKSYILKDFHKNINVTKINNNNNNNNNEILLLKNISIYPNNSRNYNKDKTLKHSAKKSRYTKKTRLNYIRRALGIFSIGEKKEENKEETKEDNKEENIEENKDENKEKNKEKIINLHHTTIITKNMREKIFAEVKNNKNVDDEDDKENCNVF